MSATTLVQANVPNDIQQTANEIIQAAGLTVGEIVQRLMQRIAHHHAIPQYLLYPEQESVAEQRQKREQAIADILEWRPNIIGPPITVEEIISARDEGRR